MKIKVVKADEAIGKRIAYDTTASTPTYKGAVIRRGKVLTREDVEVLKDNGHYYIYVYDEEGDSPDEIHEDEAVYKVAKAIAGRNVVPSPDEEGKAVLKSTKKGLLIVNISLLNEINRRGIFAVITKRTGSLVKPDETVAVVDLIPFTISAGVLRELLNVITQSGPLCVVNELVKTDVGLVVTGTEIYEGRKKDLSEDIIRKKSLIYEINLAEKVIVPDDPDEIRSAILSLITKNDAVITTGGMSVDPTDYTPGVIASLADEVIAYGVPFKPNTMTMIAYMRGKPIIGLPGGIIHYPDFNILDVLLPWVSSRTKIPKEYLLGLAHGGLSEYYLAKHKSH